MTMIQVEGGWGSWHAGDDRFQDPATLPELVAALDWLPLAALVLAADGSAIAVNRAWVALSAVARGDSQGDGWLRAVEPVDRTTLRARLRDAAAGGETGSAVFRLAAPVSRGWSRWWWRPGPGGQLVVCVAGTGGDSRGDDRWPGPVRGPLARLVPRNEFLNLAERALRRRKWTGTPVAVVVAGVEAIPGAVGTSGQPVSDQVLHAAGELILGAVGPAGAAALVGSGEFAILCGDLRRPEEAGTVAQRIGEALAQPPAAGKVPFPVVTVTGIAMASAPGGTAETLISAARRAMHAARTAQTNGPKASVPDVRAPAAAHPPPGRTDETEPAAGRPAHQAPQARPAHEPDAISVLNSVTARAFQAGLALQDVRPSGPAAADIDHALGQLEEIVRQIRDLAFQLQSAATRIRFISADRVGGSGT